jgi:hypothetical protein
MNTHENAAKGVYQSSPWRLLGNKSALICQVDVRFKQININYYPSLASNGEIPG